MLLDLVVGQLDILPPKKEEKGKKDDEREKKIRPNAQTVFPVVPVFFFLFFHHHRLGQHVFLDSSVSPACDHIERTDRIRLDQIRQRI